MHPRQVPSRHPPAVRFQAQVHQVVEEEVALPVEEGGMWKLLLFGRLIRCAMAGWNRWRMRSLYLMSTAAYPRTPQSPLCLSTWIEAPLQLMDLALAKGPGLPLLPTTFWQMPSLASKEVRAFEL